ncbi:MAG: TetR/AcrR family transcriptional regulator [Caulobacteraceae bacterium]
MQSRIGARTEAIRVGGLRSRAIDAALRRVETLGADALSLRDLASDLGTGQASLYHHFASKDALMAELACEGFRCLRQAFESAVREPRGRRPLHACGDAYLAFARKRPELYRVMYADRLLAGHPTVREAEASAFKAFADGISADQPSATVLAERAMALWAFGRGIAALTMGLPASHEPPPRDLSRQIVRGLESLIGQPIRGPRRPKD